MKISKIIFIALSALFLLSTSAVADKKITWLVSHWPPLMEWDGRTVQLTGGHRAKQLKMLQDQMPGYNHVYQEMRWNRFWNIITKGQNVCNCMSNKNRERESIAEFSIPISLTLPNHIVMQKETFKKMGSPETISLVKLLHDHNYTGGLITKRSYSSEIDEILKTHETKKKIIRSAIDEQTYIKILSGNRVDYILEYPYIIKDTIEKHFPELKNRFKLVPIEEIKPFYFSYIACPKNKWGRTVISDINKVLIDLRPSKAFRNATVSLYDGEEAKKVASLYDKYLLKQN